jgi:hypothetical protein
MTFSSFECVTILYDEEMEMMNQMKEEWGYFLGWFTMNDEVSQVTYKRWNIVDKISSLMLSFYDCNCMMVKFLFSTSIIWTWDSPFFSSIVTLLMLCKNREKNVDFFLLEQKLNSLTWLLFLLYIILEERNDFFESLDTFFFVSPTPLIFLSFHITHKKMKS